MAGVSFTRQLLNWTLSRPITLPKPFDICALLGHFDGEWVVRLLQRWSVYRCPLGNVQGGGDYNNPGSDLLSTTLPVPAVNTSQEAISFRLEEVLMLLSFMLKLRMQQCVKVEDFKRWNHPKGKSSPHWWACQADDIGSCCCF